MRMFLNLHSHLISGEEGVVLCRWGGGGSVM